MDLAGIRDKDKYCMLPLRGDIKKNRLVSITGMNSDPDNKLVVDIGRRRRGNAGGGG